MNTDEKVAFIPFNGINQFMVPEFRHEVLSTVFTGLDSLPPAQKGQINGLVKRLFKLPGFRNAALAPLGVKIRASATHFERSAEFASAVLAGWTELKSDLMSQVYHLLVERGWEVLPLDADRTRLPGLMTRWPAKETYELLNLAFSEKHPDSKASENDVRLMVVWISGRLPFEKVEGEED